MATCAQFSPRKKAMLYRCFVPGCETTIIRGENMRTKDGVTLHKLPDDNIDLELWLKILNCEHLTVSSSSRICSKHFRRYAFTGVHLRPCLKRTATPFFPDSPDKDGEKTVSTAITGQQNDISLKENQHGVKLPGFGHFDANRANDSPQLDDIQTYKACMQMKGERDYLFRKLEEQVTKKFLDVQSGKVIGKCTASDAQCPQMVMLTEAIGDIARLNQIILELTRREQNECGTPAREIVDATNENAESPRDDAEPTSTVKRTRLSENSSRGPVEEQPRQADLNLVCRWDESGESRLCGEVFHSVRDLMVHVTAHVTDGSSTKQECCWEDCPLYQHPYRCTASLIHHMYMHTGQVPYRCWRKNCGKMFTKYNQLKAHVRTHGRRSYVCKYRNCHKEFTGPYALVIHVRRDHTGEKPYGCLVDGCGETFVTKTELTHHAHTHADEVNE